MNTTITNQIVNNRIQLAEWFQFYKYGKIEALTYYIGCLLIILRDNTK